MSPTSSSGMSGTGIDGSFHHWGKSKGSDRNGILMLALKEVSPCFFRIQTYWTGVDDIFVNLFLLVTSVEPVVHKCYSLYLVKELLLLQRNPKVIPIDLVHVVNVEPRFSPSILEYV
eukprot:7292526-Ditylum_brightwellii.AAC.1